MIHRWRYTLTLALLGSAALLGALPPARSAPAGANPVIAVTDASLAHWVNQRVEEWQPTREERRFDEIGWARDIQTAERLASRHGRPVFLFTHDGRMATGRC
jgi:hypothetical protein